MALKPEDIEITVRQQESLIYFIFMKHPLYLLYKTEEFQDVQSAM